MKIRMNLYTLAAALALVTAQAASAQVILSPGANIVLTDPMVRAIQIGPPPVGAVIDYNAVTRLGLVAVPGIGVRPAQLVGVPIPWAGSRAVNAIDLATGVQFVGLLPSPPQLVPAKVVRSIGDAILVRRDYPDARVTEAVPVGSVFAAYQGGLAPATRVSGALQPGHTVLVPPDTAERARVIVQKTGSAASRTHRR